MIARRLHARTRCSGEVRTGGGGGEENDEAGRRLRTVHLLTGSTLPVWATVERALQGQGATNSSSWSGGAKSSSFTVIRVAETEDASGVAPSVKKQNLVEQS